MAITRGQAESFVGKLVDVTWEQTPEQQEYYGCVDGGMAGVVWKIDDSYLVTDDGYGVRLDIIKTISETTER